MTPWQHWLRRPRTVPLRRLCFQIHLWIGIGTGLYVVMLSLTGSALVFRREMDRAFGPTRPPVDRAARVLSVEEVTAAALRAYPDATVRHVSEMERRAALVHVLMDRNGRPHQRAFHAYTGADLGESFPVGSHVLLWLANLHDDLLMLENGRGRFWNGVGSVLVTLLCITGAVVWWPGIRNWRRGLKVKWGAAWPRVTFDLHSALGFWFFAIIAIWAVSGIYLSFPRPFTTTVDWIWGPDVEFGTRPGDVALEWLARLHFGRWTSHTLKAVWVVMGLVPAAMFVTGALMWWQRAVRRRRTPAAERSAVRLTTPAPQVE